MCVTSEVWCASVCVRTCDLRCLCAWVCAYVMRVSADPASGGRAEPLSCGPHGRGLTIGATPPPPAGRPMSCRGGVGVPWGS